ncbi:hypothetical protein HDU80_002933 [Chytriomyces hyalinus]|nr:hypothetical protein HDU80_002933 [Chytriomyces hyalinus]
MNRQSPTLNMDPRLNKLALLDTRMQESTPSPSPTESVQFRYPTATSSSFSSTSSSRTNNRAAKQLLSKQQKLRKTCKQTIMKPVVAESALLHIKSIHKMSIAFLVENVDESKMMYRSRLHYVRPKSVQDSWQRSKGGAAENALDGRRSGSVKTKNAAAASMDRTQHS